MLETLNLGKLLNIAPKLKKYLWQKLKQKKTQNVSKVTIEKQMGPSVPEISIVTVAIDNHMAVIQAQIWKNIIEDVLLIRWRFRS